MLWRLAGGRAHAGGLCGRLVRKSADNGLLHARNGLLCTRNGLLRLIDHPRRDRAHRLLLGNRYRRDDAASDAGWLADLLNRRFGSARVFLDIDTIDPGTDFERVLKSLGLVSTTTACTQLFPNFLDTKTNAGYLTKAIERTRAALEPPTRIAKSNRRK